MRPAQIITRLGLTRPIFWDTATSGHFGREGLPWETPFLPAGIGDELHDPLTAAEADDLNRLRDLLADSMAGDLRYPAGLALTQLTVRYPLTARKLRNDAMAKKEAQA